MLFTELILVELIDTYVVDYENNIIKSHPNDLRQEAGENVPSIRLFWVVFIGEEIEV